MAGSSSRQRPNGRSRSGPGSSRGKPEAMIHIDIFSDTFCPWCLIGKRRLEKALAERPGLKPAIRWRVFQLTPTMTQGGRQRQAYLTLKKSAERRVGTEWGQTWRTR